MKILSDYDDLADVLYVSFGQPAKRARTWEGEVICQLRFNDADELVGITIDAARYQAAKVRANA